MSTLKVLKEYLVGEGGYLFSDDNNSKTVMLSGAWGSGKTHFWQNEIENDLTKKLNDKSKACVYVSLYGKDNIEAIKNEILFKAYESIKDENKLAKRAISAFGFGSRLLSISAAASGVGARVSTGAFGDAVEGFFENKKIDEAESFLADGGLICLDDFERKSKNIDLNDLFGFIAQLAIDMNCKIVIILNSDVFEGEEANLFRRVKEKTVNKFFYFEPTRQELFDSIYDKKYKNLDDYREDIFSAIEETKELNARIYIQVLDNCLEWIDRGYENKLLRILVFVTTSFVLSNLVLKYPMQDTQRHMMSSETYIKVLYKELNEYHPVIQEKFSQPLSELPAETKKYTSVIENIQKRLLGKTQQGTFIFSDIDRGFIQKELTLHKFYLQTLWKFGYQLYYFNNIDKESYEVIVKFVETGILLSKVNS